MPKRGKMRRKKVLPLAMYVTFRGQALTEASKFKLEWQLEQEQSPARFEEIATAVVPADKKGVRHWPSSEQQRKGCLCRKPRVVDP